MLGRRPSSAPASARRARTPGCPCAGSHVRSACRRACSRRSSAASRSPRWPRSGRSSASSGCRSTRCSPGRTARLPKAVRAIVQRAAKRPAIELGGGVVWERLTAAPDRDADFAFVTYPPGADSGADDPPTSHLGREYGYVIGGRLQIEVGDEVVELGPGDAVAFGSETPHRFRSLGDEPVTAVWLNVRARV